MVDKPLITKFEVHFEVINVVSCKQKYLVAKYILKSDIYIHLYSYVVFNRFALYTLLCYIKLYSEELLQLCVALYNY